MDVILKKRIVRALSDDLKKWNIAFRKKFNDDDIEEDLTVALPPETLKKVREG